MSNVTNSNKTSIPITAAALATKIELHDWWVRGYAGGARADFSNTDLGGHNLRGANLRMAIFNSTNMTGTDLRAANFDNCMIMASSMVNADCRGASFRNASFHESDLTGADFRGAEMTKAYLGAMHPDTNFAGATMNEVGVGRRNRSELRSVEFTHDGAQYAVRWQYIEEMYYTGDNNYVQHVPEKYIGELFSDRDVQKAAWAAIDEDAARYPCEPI